MTPTQPHVTDAELAVLEVLWQDEPCTIRTLTDELYPDGGTSEYATVQKLLERLEAKGFVTRDRGAIPHLFRSRVDRSKLISHRLKDLADTFCEGSMTPLLTQLLEQGKFTKKDVDTLRDLVRKLDKGRGKK